MNKSYEKKPKEDNEEILIEEQTSIVPKIGGNDVFNEFPKLQNNVFGDVVMIIESYNAYIKLYGQIKSDDILLEDIKLPKIEYDKFIQMLNDEENKEENHKYYLSIVETLLRVIMNNDKYMLSNNFSEKFKINDFSMQDLCRVILQLNTKTNVVEDIEMEGVSDRNIKSTFDLFLYQEDKVIFFCLL